MTSEQFVQGGAGGQSSKRVFQEKEKRELLEYLNGTDCNEEFSGSNRLWRIRGEGGKSCTDRKHYHSKLYDAALNNAYTNTSREY